MKDIEIINKIKEWLQDNIEYNVDITLYDNKLLLSYINKLQNKKD
jgi:hypothetical protein